MEQIWITLQSIGIGTVRRDESRRRTNRTACQTFDHRIHLIVHNLKYGIRVIAYPMPAEIVTLVRLPISEAVDMLRQRHRITETFSEVRLEDEYLAFYFEAHLAECLEVRLEDEYLAFYFVHPSSQSNS